MHRKGSIKYNAIYTFDDGDNSAQLKQTATSGQIIHVRFSLFAIPLSMEMSHWMWSSWGRFASWSLLFVDFRSGEVADRRMLFYGVHWYSQIRLDNTNEQFNVK